MFPLIFTIVKIIHFIYSKTYKTKLQGPKRSAKRSIIIRNKRSNTTSGGNYVLLCILVFTCLNSIRDVAAPDMLPVHV